MKKNTRYILITLVAAVVLGGTVAALLLTPQKAKEESSSSSQASSSTRVSLFSYEDQDIQSITVKNADAQLKILSRTEEIKTSSKDKSESSKVLEKTVFYLDGINEKVQKNYEVSILARYGISLSATSEIGNAKDLSLKEYGLDAPKVTITTVLKNGKETSYAVGGESPVSGCYVLYEDKVYVSDLGQAIYKTPFDFVINKLVTLSPLPSEHPNGEPANQYTKFTFSGTNFPEEVRIILDKESLLSSFRLTVPYEVNADNDVMKNVTASLDDLTASSVVAVAPTEKQLAEYGLKDPAVRMSFTANGDTYTLLSGKIDGSSQYIMLEGLDVIYAFNSKVVSAWADASLFTLRDSFVWLQMITDVGRLTMETPDKKDVFTIHRTENEDKSTEDNTVYQYTVEGTDGREITYSSIFTYYYETVIGVQLLDDTSEKKPSGKPMLRVTYEFYEDDTPKVVEYYKIGNRRCLVQVDGRTVGVVSEKVVQQVIDNTEIVLQNKNVRAEENK